MFYVYYKRKIRLVRKNEVNPVFTVIPVPAEEWEKL
jgi:hypothetical protein